MQAPPTMNRLIAPVTGLKFIQDDQAAAEPYEKYLFAAVGNQVQIFLDGTEKPCTIESIFPHEYRIYGFSDVANGQMIIYGGRIVALARIKFAKSDIGVELLERIEFPDWVWDVHWLPGNGLLAVACGHSTTYICDAENLQHSCKLQSEEKELTWSTTLFTDSGELFAVAGSSFGDILSWKVLSAKLMEKLLKGGMGCINDMKEVEGLLPAHRIKAHYGPIMRLRISEDRRYVATASVDRTVQVWKRENGESVPSGGCCFTHLLTHYGHLARVWDVCFTQGIGGIGVVSVGEDHVCRIWGEKPGLEKACFYGHSGRNIWSVAVSHGLVATGGEDGGILVRTLQGGVTIGPLALPKFENPRKKGLFKECGRSIIATDCSNFIMTTDYGRILRGRFENGDVNWVVVFSQATAFTPCSLVVHGEMILAGRTDGSVVALRNEVFIGSLQIEGMVMGVFADAMNNNFDVLISSPSGCVSHYHISLHDNITFLGIYRMQKPVKSSLVTAACVMREQSIIITGDRGGRVHTYPLRNRTNATPRLDSMLHPSQTLRLHTDRISTITRLSGETIQTTSFDGSITHLHTTQTSLSLRLRNRLPSRTDTITCAKHGLLFGLHGAEGVVWDSRNREALRANIGNWRRAHDITRDGVVYWRGGVCYTRCDNKDWGMNGGLGGRVNGMCVTREGVVVCGDGMRMFHGEECVQVLKGHRSSVHAVASGLLDGVVVLVSVGGLDEMFVWSLCDRLWKVENVVKFEDGMTGRLISVCVCENGVFVGRSDGSLLKLVNENGERHLMRIWRCDGGVLSMDWKNQVLVVGDTQGWVYTFHNGKWERSEAHEGGVNAIKHFKNGVISGGDDGYVKYHLLQNGKLTKKWECQEHSACVGGLDAMTEKAVSVGGDHRLVEWDECGRRKWRKHAVADVSCVEYTPDLKGVVIGGIGMCGVRL